MTDIAVDEIHTILAELLVITAKAADIIRDLRFRAERAEMRAEMAENDLAAAKAMH